MRESRGKALDNRGHAGDQEQQRIHHDKTRTSHSSRLFFYLEYQGYKVEQHHLSELNSELVRNLLFVTRFSAIFLLALLLLLRVAVTSTKISLEHRACSFSS